MNYIHIVISSEEFKGTHIVSICSPMVKNTTIENAFTPVLVYGNQCVNNVEWEKLLEKNNFYLSEDGFHSYLGFSSILKGYTSVTQP